MWAGITAVEKEAAEALTLTADCVGNFKVPGSCPASGEDGWPPTNSITDVATDAGAVASVETLEGSTGDICGGDSGDCKISVSYSACDSDIGCIDEHAAGCTFTVAFTLKGPIAMRLDKPDCIDGAAAGLDDATVVLNDSDFKQETVPSDASGVSVKSLFNDEIEATTPTSTT